VLGVLELDGVATGRQRLVAVRLGNPADYEAALAAHQAGRVVRAEGAVTITRGKRGITSSDDGFLVTDRTRT
jgi:hypothetical protein